MQPGMDLKLLTTLAADTSGEQMRQLQDGLQQARHACRTALDRGQAPQEAARLRVLMDALGLGADLLPQIWQRQRSAAPA